MVSSCRNNGTISQELRYPFTGTVVQFWQESSINVRVLKRKSKNPSNLDWYLQKKISTDFLKKVYNAYLQIQEWLIETGDTFCCIVPENEKLSELDLMVNIKSVHRYRLQSPLFVGGV